MHREIEASTKVRATVDGAHDLIVRDPAAVVAGEWSTDEGDTRRFHTTLGVERLVVELGPARRTEEAVVVGLHWEAEGRDTAGPAFDGELEVRRDAPGSRLELHGTYTAPAASEATFERALSERRLARQSLAAFLEQAARRLDGVDDRRGSALAVEVTARPPASADEPRSETFLG